MEKYHATAVYVGHEHLYNRRIVTDAFFLSEGKQILDNEIPQVTSGGAGAPLEFAGSNIRNIALGPLSVFNYVIVNICGSVVVSKEYDINESCIDSFIYDSANVTNMKDQL